MKHSRKYRDKWTDVPDIELGDADLDKHVSNIKSNLDNLWVDFTVYTQTHAEICHKGRINEKRLPSSKRKDEEVIIKTKIDAFIESLEVKDISEILWTVHEMTGFLDCFKLVNS